MPTTEFDMRAAAIAIQEWWLFGSQFVDGDVTNLPIKKGPGHHGTAGDESRLGFKQRTWAYFKFGVFPDSNKWKNFKAEPWSAGPAPGLEVLPLYSDLGWPETMCLERLAPGTALPREACPGGKEVFVLEGQLEDEEGRYPGGAWLRLPPDSHHEARSAEGCICYVKRGHLADMAP